ncbi:MAG: thymidine phosphorylase [Acidimicrobiia bacterium]
MKILDLIERKRDGGRLSDPEIRWVIGAFTTGDVPDYQMSALLMAVFVRGLDLDELAIWTEAMLHSGEVLDFSSVPTPKVDKHSTGGVGDKVSIPLAPMVAACGVAVPMMSGRGLGHTMGTLDKLESIPGFTVRLDPDRFRAVLEECGLVLAGQSETLVPADRRIYALRDATGTVPSIPLIASSIMSKKLAEGLDGLVLDVKVGTGAFMKTPVQARDLAETMVGIGRSHGTRVVALLTDMNEPLGSEVGHANEITESIAMLRGKGPADLQEVTFRLAEEMLLLSGVHSKRADARVALEGVISTGAALERLAKVIQAQGGDPAVVHDTSLLPRAPHQHQVSAESSGCVTRCDALSIGRAATLLGAGRERKEDDIDHGVGITLHAKTGSIVDKGQALATVTWREETRLRAAVQLLHGAWTIGEAADSLSTHIVGEVR